MTMAGRRGSRSTGPARLDDALRRCRQAEQAVERLQRHEIRARTYDGIAHDLNNLFGVISNSAHLLQQLAAEPQAQAAVAACLRAVDRASRLTAQVRAAGNVATARAGTPVDFGDLLASMHDLLGAMLGRRIVIERRVAAGTLPVAVARDDLELALLALLLNARDAMPRGGRLCIDVRNAEPDEVAANRGAPTPAMVSICVSDEGSGIADAIAARAFDAYLTTRAEQGACGLGLSRVKAFCEAAGGSASLDSTAGLGTSVTLWLPAFAPPVQGPRTGATTAGAPAAAAADAAPDRLAGARLLLVEDNRELAAVTAALLATFGLQVRQAHNAEQAMTMIAAQPGLDIVLSDVVMPGGVDGVELAHRIRRRWPGLPVVLITAYSTALGEAADFPVLHKPCSADLLIATLRRQLPAARPAADPHGPDSAAPSG